MARAPRRRRSRGRAPTTTRRRRRPPRSRCSVLARDSPPPATTLSAPRSSPAGYSPRPAPPTRRRVAARVRVEASERTHPLSATLLGDLADGQSYASLHDLVHGLTREAPAAARDAARRLVRLGHSSGWDMLAGLGAGLGA